MARCGVRFWSGVRSKLRVEAGGHRPRCDELSRSCAICGHPRSGFVIRHSSYRRLRGQEWQSPGRSCPQRLFRAVQPPRLKLGGDPRTTAKRKPTISGNRPRPRSAGASLRCPPRPCRCRVSAALGGAFELISVPRRSRGRLRSGGLRYEGSPRSTCELLTALAV